MNSADPVPGDAVRALRDTLVLTVVLCGLALLTGLAGAVSGAGPFEVLDDSYMYVRYADNLLHHGRVAWNPGGDPVYGLTSLLTLPWVVWIRALIPHNAALASATSSATCGVVFLCLLGALLFHDIGAGRLMRLVLVAFISIVLTYSVDDLRFHFTSGMDTTFDMAFLTGYILVGRRHERTGSRATLIAMGLWGGLAWFARPDLMLYALLVPIAMIVTAGNAAARRRGWIALAVTAVVAGAQILAALAYFHTPVPLSFYAKAWQGYEDFNLAKYAPVPGGDLLAFVHSYRLLLAAIVADVASDPRGWWRRSTPVDKAVGAATVLFALYYLTSVLQILHHHQRFYYPMLPALVYLGARSALNLWHRLAPAERSGIARLPRPVWNAGLIGVVVLLAMAPRTGVLEVTSALRRRAFAHFDVLAEYRARNLDDLVELEAVSKLPRDLVMATTEVGRPSALNPDKTIVDLSGLNEPLIARQGFSTATAIRRYRPDLVYMPPPDYRGMIRSMLSDSLFAREYEHISPERLRATMGVALRRESKYYFALRQLMDRRLAAAGER